MVSAGDRLLAYLRARIDNGDIAGPRVSLLFGALADTGRPDVAACPDQISDVVAASFALTECGRLFRWSYGRVVELSRRRDRRFCIACEGITWLVGCDTLLDRVFPERAVPGSSAVDWSTYDPDGPLPGARDPLAPRSYPGDSGIVYDAPDGAHAAAWRLWYGD